MPLDAKHFPLKHLAENPILTLTFEPTEAMTIGDTVYVHDLEEFLSEIPEFRLTALLLHEQVHSIRQQAYGVFPWILKYLVDKNFALHEEKLGWAAHLLWLRDHGHDINRDVAAYSLSNYMVLTGYLISEEDARIWVDQVLDQGLRPN